MDIGKILSRMDDPMDFEALLDELSLVAPPPDFQAANSFFSNSSGGFGGGTEDSLAQNITQQQIAPIADLDSVNAGQSILPPALGTEDPLSSDIGGGADIGALLSQFAGAQPSKDFQPHFAPAPGLPGRGGTVNIQQNAAAGNVGGPSQNPLESLAALIMRGAT